MSSTDKLDDSADMRRLPVPLFLLTVLALPLAGQDEASPVARRAGELIALINKGDNVELQDYLEKTLGERMLEFPMSMHLSIMGGLHRRGPWSVNKVVSGDRLERDTLLHNGKDDWIRLSIGVEPTGEHKIAGIGVSNGVAPPEPSRDGRYTDDQIRAEMDRCLDTLHASDRFSGAVMLARDGEVVYSGVRGEANKDFGVANTIETKFNLGSMNKMFTAIAIAQLADQGKLRLDDPLAKFLPEFPSADEAKRVRIEHLLTHTSGLGSYFNQKFLDSSRARFRSVEQLLTLAQDERVQFEPGSRWRYSNTGFLVLGRVVEVASGQDYHDYIREHVTGPAGMTSTDCYELDHVNRNLAVGYHRMDTPSGPQWRNNVFMHVIRGGPAGGGYSTVGDLVRFAAALRSGKLLTPEMFAEVIKPRPELNSENYGYGFGLSSDGSVGHSGGFQGISSNLSFWPDGGWTVAVMGNYSGAAQPVMAQIRQLIGSEPR